MLICLLQKLLSALEILKTDKSHIVADNNEILGLTFFVGQVFAHQKGFLAEEIIGAFNDLVSKGMVKGVLCPLSSVELDPIDLDKKEAIFLFAHIDDPKKYVQEKYSHLVALEGEIGELHVY